MTGQADLLELIATDPVHRDDREAVIDAIRTAVTEHGTVISSNDWRPHLPTWVHCKAVGATVSYLIGLGVLTPTGSPTRSNDVKGGNSGRWIPRYKTNLGLLP